jgi:hypothetical protein
VADFAREALAGEPSVNQLVVVLRSAHSHCDVSTKSSRRHLSFRCPRAVVSRRERERRPRRAGRHGAAQMHRRRCERLRSPARDAR